MSPDNRQHRGAHPEDRRLFDSAQLPGLRAAMADLCWLLSRGYAINSSLKLVGDRYTLAERQRVALARAACSDASRNRRRASCLALPDLHAKALAVDGFNLLISVEAALGGGLIMRCRDECLRDLSSVHGTYRSVQETDRALQLIGETLATLAPESVVWLLDRPISNSGMLAQRIRDLAMEQGWPWSVEVVFDPDRALIASDKIVVSTDSNILEGAARWANFSAHLITRYLPQAWLIDLSEQTPSSPS